MREERLNREREDRPPRYRGILIHKTLSDLICKQRKLHNPRLTQEELAFRSGISFEHLNRIENYRSTASLEVLDRIARALGFKRVSDFLSCDMSRVL
jgi:ribosome-binding protein aMBF1 (putative translation factor)